MVPVKVHFALHRGILLTTPHQSDIWFTNTVSIAKRKRGTGHGVGATVHRASDTHHRVQNEAHGGDSMGRPLAVQRLVEDIPWGAEGQASKRLRIEIIVQGDKHSLPAKELLVSECTNHRITEYKKSYTSSVREQFRAQTPVVEVSNVWGFRMNL